MARWTRDPVADNELHSYDLVRTPTGRSLHAIVLEHKFVWTYLHYWKRRTLPCVEAPGTNPPASPDDFCPACKTGRQARQTGFVFCQEEKSGRIFIFEITKRAFDAFDAYFTLHGTLRGCRFVAQRTNKEDNGPVRITCAEGNFDSGRLPSPTGVTLYLDNMWEVKPSHATPFGESQHDETLITPEQREERLRIAK